MRKSQFALLFAALAVLVLTTRDSFAKTYYISYSSGSNSNNGTSEAAPWKTHPYMQTASACTGTGSAPNYTHSSGDTFIFKMGDSWPNACFDMVISSGGISGAPDTYTYDSGWGAAGGTTGNTGQAVGVYRFTAGGSIIDGKDGFNRFINVTANYVTLNGAEFTGMTWTGTGGTYHNEFMVDMEDSTNINVTNCYFHGWTHSGATNDVLYGVVGSTSSPFNTGSTVSGNVFDGANSGGKGVSDSGGATYSVPEADNNIAQNMSNGLLVSANVEVHDNLIGPINNSFDANDHENCIEPVQLPSGQTVTNYFYNNVWHDCTAVGILTQGAAPSSGAEIDYLWNNVAYVGSVSSPPIPFQFDSVSTNMAGSAVYAYHNTIYGGSGVCFRTSNRGNGSFGTLDWRNNHCITSGATFAQIQATGKTQNIANNIVDTSSTGFNSPSPGLPPPYAYSPTSSASATVGQGQNLSGVAKGPLASLAGDTSYAGFGGMTSRGGTSCTPTPGVPGCWDAGAYQFAAGQPTPPSNLQAAVQ